MQYVGKPDATILGEFGRLKAIQDSSGKAGLFDDADHCNWYCLDSRHDRSDVLPWIIQPANSAWWTHLGCVICFDLFVLLFWHCEEQTSLPCADRLCVCY